MGWLLLVVLGIMWAVFLLPGRKGSPHRSVEDFERNMDMLAETEAGAHGRWIVTPRKGMAFVGTRERAKARARERRRRVFVFLIESIGLSALIGLVPPLRAMWYATGLLLVVLGAYVWLLVSIRSGASELGERIRAAAPAAPERPGRERYAADAAARTPRPAFNGLATLGGDELVNIVVKPAGQVGMAGV